MKILDTIKSLIRRRPPTDTDLAEQAEKEILREQIAGDRAKWADGQGGKTAPPQRLGRF